MPNVALSYAVSLEHTICVVRNGTSVENIVAPVIEAKKSVV